MTHNIENGILTMMLPERIDTTSAEAVSQELTDICKVQHEKIVLDASETKYISSSGLRVILLLSRKEKSLHIKNVCKEVYDIFYTTNFTEIMKIDRALRHVHIAETDKTGIGTQGAVYRIDDENIVKVNYRGSSYEEVEREITAAHKAFAAGIPTAIAYDIVDCGNGRLGTVYEAIHSDTLDVYTKDHFDEEDTITDRYAELLRCLHSKHTQTPSLPRTVDVIEENLQLERGALLSDEAIEKIRQLLHLMPDSDVLIHGDGHSSNVMLMNGELLFIDLGELSIGHPIYDIMNFYFIENFIRRLPHHAHDGQGKEMTREQRGKFSYDTLKKYFGYDNGQMKNLFELLDNLVPYAAATKFLPIMPDWAPKEKVGRGVEEWASHLDAERIAALAEKVKELNFPTCES